MKRKIRRGKILIVTVIRSYISPSSSTIERIMIVIPILRDQMTRNAAFEATFDIFLL